MSKASELTKRITAINESRAKSKANKVVINEASDGFVEKDQGLSNAPALWSVDGNVYIAYAEKSFEVGYNQDDPEAVENFTDFNKAVEFAKSKKASFNQAGLDKLEQVSK